MATDTTILQQQTIAETPSNWSQTVTFAPFDPTLGTLTDVQIGVTAEVTGTVSLDNLGPTSGTDYVSLPGTVSVFGPDDAPISSVTATANGSASLGAFDGTDNYLGNSGTTLAGLSGTQSFLDIYQGTTSELALFSGSNPVPLTVDASVLFEEMGSGNLQALSHASAGAVISLQYDYIPTPPSGPGSGFGSYSSVTSTTAQVGLFIETLTPITLTTAAQTITVAEAPTGWSTELSAAQFDPALGTLDSVNITLTGDETASVAAANLGATAATLGFSETPTLTLVTPDPTTYVSATPSVTGGMSLAGYDGSEDFAGTSGRTDQGLTATAPTTAELTSPSDLAAFTGDGSITLPLYAFSASSLSGPADLLTQLADQAGATVSISYTYTPAETETFVDLELVHCFAAGTRIATAQGEVAVEHLRVGDAVRTVLGTPLGTPAAPIIWIGRREVDCARHPHPRRVWPVRVAAGAFGPGRPGKELFLSPDHAVYVNNVLIPIKHLINGSSIAQVPVDHVTYYHLELPRHDVLLAEGLPTESFLDLRDGAHYADRLGPTRLYPDFSARMWEAFGCARLIVTGPELAAARALVVLHAVRREAA
jgi:collagen type I/II/III/V/XI/XXIV/XXVII alpha